MEARNITNRLEPFEDRTTHLEHLLALHEQTIELQAARILVLSLAVSSLIQAQAPNQVFAQTLQSRVDATLARGDASQDFERYVKTQLSELLATADQREHRPGLEMR